MQASVGTSPELPPLPLLLELLPAWGMSAEPAELLPPWLAEPAPPG
jgi:hypothetical protein